MAVSLCVELTNALSLACIRSSGLLRVAWQQLGSYLAQRCSNPEGVASITLIHYSQQKGLLSFILLLSRCPFPSINCSKNRRFNVHATSLAQLRGTGTGTALRVTKAGTQQSLLSAHGRALRQSNSLELLRAGSGRAIMVVVGSLAFRNCLPSWLSGRERSILAAPFLVKFALLLRCFHSFLIDDHPGRESRAVRFHLFALLLARA